MTNGRKHSKKSDKLDTMSLMMSKLTLDPSFAKCMRPTLIVGLLFFKDSWTCESLTKIVTERIATQFVEFRSIRRLDSRGIVSSHELSIEDLDLDYHIRNIDAVGWSQVEISKFLTDIYQERKDPQKPWWVYYILNDLQDGRSCIVVNIDHAIGDGISMIEVLLSTLDDDILPRSVEQSRMPARPTQWPSISPLEKWVATIVGAVSGVFGIFGRDDSESCIKLKDCRKPGVSKACAIGEPISLDRIKEIRKHMPGFTVNDILAAVLNMCLMRYLEHHMDPIISDPSKLCRANFPINMRKKGVSAKDCIGNFIATGSLRFNFHYRSRVELLRSVKRQVDFIKASPQPLIEYLLLEALAPLLPAAAFVNLTLDYFGKYTMMMSNVMGPQSVAHMGGRAIDSISALAATSIGLYAGMLSYNGSVVLTLSSDASTMPDPDVFASFWRPEFEALYKEVCKEVEAEEVAAAASRPLDNDNKMPHVCGDGSSCSRVMGWCAKCSRTAIPLFLLATLGATIALVWMVFMR